MVETALVLLAAASLMIGAVDFGQFLFVHQALVERARSSARWGAIYNAQDTQAIRNMVLYNNKEGGDGGGYFGLEPSMVRVSTAGANSDDYRLNLLITDYPYRMLAPFIAGTYRGPDILITVPIGL